MVSRLVASCLIAIAFNARAQGITGAGGTFPAPVYAQWGELAHAAIGVDLDYHAIGSGGGQEQILSRKVDFGASDAPMSDAQLMAGHLLQFPTIMGGVVVVVNLPRVRENALRLTGEVLADIFAGKIRKWNDARLVELNPGVTMPNISIAPVHRYDASGTSFVFTSYLAAVSPGWKDQVGVGTSVDWLAGAGAIGSDGVASTVTITRGGIGYVESAFAAQNHLTTVQLRNRSGAFVKPTIESFIEAAAATDWNVPNFAVSLVDANGAGTWPIVSTTYILLPKDPKEAERSAAVLRFFDLAYRDGGKAAAALDYGALPIAVQDSVRAAWRTQVRANGAPVFK